MLEQLLEARYLWWLWDGFLVTLAISLLTIIFSTILGFLLVIAQQSGIKLIKGMVVGYNAIFRYSPLLPQLFFWYFGIGNLLPTEFKIWLFDEPQIQLWFFTLKMPSFEFIIGFIGLTCYSSAFIAEEFRAGIAGVSVGQQQASLALGLTWWQSMRFIILPQSFCIAFTPLIGQYMNIVKNSSLTMAIGVLELSYVSRQVETESLKTFQDFAVATFLYILAIVIIGTLGNIYQTKRFPMGRM
ncbi:amino acid ABC transporter permease [Gilliamella apicola]|uniref:amino acid ABC transporter permease n=1 Tax=Gilliamella apicola TaxID=1196095 RepID=UPI000A3352ED|nr:amino acid ABC transporter permease [Gilliamella apicola]OTQ01123.1 amino acid ABC transporter permease [Gilliamella apicola]OTQ21947.1 amino acid ABC transporter permease [Gilliamella apicola]